MVHKDDLMAQIKELLPKDAMITDYAFEAANIVLYTNNKFFFFNNKNIVKSIVDTVKKRIEIRPDPSILRDPEETKEVVKSIVPAEAGLADIWFDAKRSIIILEAKDPGLVIGPGGETLDRIKNETIWVPKVRRAPIIPSDIIKTIRYTYFENSEYRRKFLHEVGERIYSGWERNDKYWVRLSCLGGFREVGRSALLVQTPETTALLDCGLNVASEKYAYPYLDAPEFDIKKLDLVIISHAHMDHCLTPDTLVQLSDGEIAPIIEIDSGQPVKTLDFKYSMQIEDIPAIQRGSIEALNPIYEVRTQTKRIKATGNHPVFVLDKFGALQIKHVEQLKPGEFIATPNVIEVKGSEQRLPKFKGKEIDLTEDVAQILGYILGDGGKRSITDNLKFYSEKLENLGIKYSAEFTRWIASIDSNILCRSPKREAPKVICKSNKNIVAAFLRGLYDAEGCVKHHSVVFSTSSEKLAIMLQMLLLRFGIISYLYDHDTSKSTFKSGPAYQVCVSSPESLAIFTKKIGFSDKRKSKKLQLILQKVGKGVKRTDLVPINEEVILRVSTDLRLRKIDLRKLGINHYHYSKHYPTKEKMVEICKRLSEVAKQKGIVSEYLQALTKLATAQIYWDKVVSAKIIKTDKKDVYDLTVPGHSNYIANGIFVHNCGFLPYLFKYGYRGPVYTTEPTRDIMTLLQLDAIDIAQKEGKKAIYDSRDVKEMIKHVIALDYDVVTDVAPDMRMTFHNAGHIIGSAMTHLNIGEGYHNLLYTGDYKYGDSKLLNAANTKFLRLETVISESTYGGKDDVLKSREYAEEYLKEIIKKTVARNGKVLIPVLGVGRAQEMTLVVEEMARKGEMPKVPVFIDGMVWDVTAITTAYPEFLSKDTKDLIFGQDHNPFISDVIRRVASQKERMQVLEETGPCVILATSGMLTGGPSLEYFRHLADNPNNSMVFVAYQGPGSYGKEIQDGAEEIVIESMSGKPETIKIKIERHTIRELTGHSDRNEINNFVTRLYPRPRRLIFNHGESSKCLGLSSFFHKMMRVETMAPRDLDVVRLG